VRITCMYTFVWTFCLFFWSNFDLVFSLVLTISISLNIYWGDRRCNRITILTHQIMKTVGKKFISLQKWAYFRVGHHIDNEIKRSMHWFNFNYILSDFRRRGNYDRLFRDQCSKKSISLNDQGFNNYDSLE